ncbi:MAG: transporter substrate-binding domain-containing protein [bacterium]|nr:transporter substrate-binding domain-containing protein [bacterium]
MNLNKQLRQSAFLLAAASLVVAVSTASGQGEPVPTLVPPTLVPVSEASLIDALPSESGIGRIQRDSRVRVGILFNEPFFGELGERCCEVNGFDADLARAMAETWGVQLEGVQVTRQTGIDLVAEGEIDLLIAAQPHLRELDARVEFSQAYYPGAQSLMVRDGDGATILAHMTDRIVGVVVGTRGQQAVQDWIARAGYNVNVRTFYTLDQAVGALRASEIDGVVSEAIRLRRYIAQPSDGRLVEEAVQPEYYAVAVRRQDANLRNLVNRTLQYLYLTDRLNQIHKDVFGGVNYPDAQFIVWNNVNPDTAPRPDQFPADVPLPSAYVVPRLQTERQLRVAGLVTLPDDAPESQRRVDQLNRLLVNTMAERWQVTVIDLDDNGQNPLDLIASGGADLAVGVTADWNAVNQADFTGYYLLHGYRLMVEANANIVSLGDLRGRWIGTFSDDSAARDLFRARAEAERAIIDDFFGIGREQDAAFGMLVDNNYDAVFADSLRLVPAVQAQADLLELTATANGAPIWYTRQYRSLAVPRNDIDFRLLVEYTLQEIARDGTLQSYLGTVMLPNDIPTFEIWGGSSDYVGYDLDRR